MIPEYFFEEEYVEEVDFYVSTDPHLCFFLMLYHLFLARTSTFVIPLSLLITITLLYPPSSLHPFSLSPPPSLSFLHPLSFLYSLSFLHCLSTLHPPSSLPSLFSPLSLISVSSNSQAEEEGLEIVKELCRETRILLEEIISKGNTDTDNSYVHSHIEDGEASDGHCTDEHSDNEKSTERTDDGSP